MIIAAVPRIKMEKVAITGLRVKPSIPTDRPHPPRLWPFCRGSDRRRSSTEFLKKTASNSVLRRVHKESDATQPTETDLQEDPRVIATNGLRGRQDSVARAQSVRYTNVSRASHRTMNKDKRCVATSIRTQSH
jgi:hypothetical protein